MRGIRVFACALALLGAAQFGAPPTQAQTVGINGNFIIFDVPGSTCLEQFAQCIRVLGIDPGGTVTGYYADAQQVLHGFLRTPDGKFAAVEPPDAVCPPPEPFPGICSWAFAINPAGAIIGFYSTGAGLFGFLRSVDGAYTLISPPGATFVRPYGISPEGSVTGYYEDQDGNAHGFIRDARGHYASFDDPDGVYGTVGIGIDAKGDVAGYYLDEDFNQHGFLRTSDGSLVPIDPVGSIATTVVGINTNGEVAGWYQTNDSVRGFLRAKNGTIATFTVLNSRETEVTAVNPAGATTGFFNGVSRRHGFLRTANGAVISFDPSTLSLFPLPSAINPGGAIAGSFIDTAFLEHGFIRLPSASETASLRAARRR